MIDGHLCRFFCSVSLAFLSISMWHIHTSVCSNFARFFFSMLNMNHECERECVCECVCMNSLCVVNSCVKCEFVATAAAMAVFCFYSDFLWRKTRNWMRASFLFIHTYSLVSFFCSLFLFLINQTLNYWVEHIFSGLLKRT